MSVIGSLMVTVGANTQNLSRGMSKGRAEIGLFNEAVNSLKSTMLGLTGAFSAGFAVHGLRSTIDDMANLARTAKRLDVSTEALGGLSFAAEQLGSSQEALSKALTFMEKNVGNSKEAITGLGLSFDQLKSMKADQMFLTIADAINKLPSASDKTASTLAIFGKASADLAPLIASGRGEIEKLTAEAEKLGYTFDSVTADKMMKAEEAMKQMSAAGKGLGRELATALAPAASLFGKTVEENITADRRFLFGTEKGPRQAAADKFVGAMSDSNFSDFTKSNPLGQMDEFLGKAMRDRMDKIVEAQGKTAAESGAVPGFTGMLGIGTSFVMNQAAIRMAAEAKDMKATGGFEGIDDPAQIARIQNSIDELDIAGNAPEKIKSRRLADRVQGSSALEFGTAAAFSQGARGQQASKVLDINQKQLKEAEKQTKALETIDKNLANEPQVLTMDIA